MVSGKPYISVNKATRKALNAPNERQSRAVRGLKKVNAKKMNSAEFRSTKDQRPYAGVSDIAASSITCAGGSGPRFSAPDLHRRDCRRDRHVPHACPDEEAGKGAAAGKAANPARADGARLPRGRSGQRRRRR